MVHVVTPYDERQSWQIWIGRLLWTLTYSALSTGRVGGRLVVRQTEITIREHSQTESTQQWNKWDDCFLPSPSSNVYCLTLNLGMKIKSMTDVFCILSTISSNTFKRTSWTYKHQEQVLSYDDDEDELHGKRMERDYPRLTHIRCLLPKWITLALWWLFGCTEGHEKRDGVGLGFNEGIQF